MGFQEMIYGCAVYNVRIILKRVLKTINPESSGGVLLLQ
jgi:hypothetical protein